MVRTDVTLRWITGATAVLLCYVAAITPVGWIQYYGWFHIITTLLGAGVMLALIAGVVWMMQRMHAWSDPAVVALAVGVAVVLRGIWVALVDTSPTSDFLEYHRYAAEVAHGDLLAHGWFFIVFPFKVVYALMLGGIYAVTTPQPYVAGIVNIAASCGIVVMMYVIAHRVYGRDAARNAAMLAAVWPLQIVFTSVAAQEHIFLLLFLCIVASMLAIPHNGNLARIALQAGGIGIIIALANLFRPVAVIAFPVLGVFVLVWRWKTLSQRRIYRATTVGAAVVVFVASTSLMSIPIERTTGIDISKARPGFSLYVGTHAPSHGMWFPESYNIVYDTGYNADTVHVRSMQAALQQVTRNPLGMVVLAMEKFHYFWASGEYAVMYATREMGQRGISPVLAEHHTSALVASQAMYAVLLAMAGVALWRRRSALTQLDGIVVTTVVVHVACFTVLEIQSRYHMVVELMLLFPAAFLLRGMQRPQSEGEGRAWE